MGQKEPASGGKPEIVVLFCQHGLAPDQDLAGDVDGFEIRPAMMPCSSKVQLPHLFRLLENGAEAVVVAACPAESCRLLVGSRRAERRLERAKDLLVQAGLDPARLEIIRVSRLSAAELREKIRPLAAVVRSLGPNPMKGVTPR